MEANEAHAYYVDLKNKGTGAAMFKQGLGFGGAASTPGSQKFTQFVAESQSNRQQEQTPGEAAAQQALPQQVHVTPPQQHLHPQPRPQLQPQTQPQLQPQPQPQPAFSPLPQQQHQIRNGLPPHLQPPQLAGPAQPRPPPLMNPVLHMRPPGMGGPGAGIQRPLMPPPPMHGQPMGRPGPPAGPGGPSSGRGGPPGGRGGPPPDAHMPPGMRPLPFPPGMAPGMRPPGMMHGFPPDGSPHAFPGMRPPGGPPPHPPHMAPPPPGPPRPPPPGMHPSQVQRPQHPIPFGRPPQQHTLLHHPQHPPQHPQHLAHQQRPPFIPPQQQRPHHLPPDQIQHPQQHPGQQQQQQQPVQSNATGRPSPIQQQAGPLPRPLVGAQSPGLAPQHAPAAGAEQAASRPAPQQAPAPHHTPEKLAGWIAHKNPEGQVYYHNTASGESSWQKPEGFEGEPVSAGGVPIPVSTEDIPLTGWAEVTCSDGRKYFYHADRQETSWSKPPEVAAALAKAIKAGSSKRAGMSADQMAIIARLKASNAELDLRPELREAKEEINNDDVTFTDQDIGRPAGIPPPLPPGQHPVMFPGVMPGAQGMPMRPMPFPGAFATQQAGLGPAVPARGGPPTRSHAELVQDFKELLLEEGVTPFSRWERELPKLLGDSRYKAIDKPKERRQIFDDFCRNVAEEQKRSKQRKEQLRAAAEPAFLALLDEAQAWNDIADRGATPPPPPTPPPLPVEIGDAEEAEDPEASNKEVTQDVYEEPAPQPEKSLTAESTPEQLEDAWSEDPRWQACEAAVRERLLLERIALLQAQQAQASEADKAAQEHAFRSLLQDIGVTAASRYSRTRESLRSDGRYKAMPKAAREPAFKRFVADLQEAEEVKAKQDAVAAEREAGARKAEADASRRQQEAAHNDAVAGFQTLLAETVKDPTSRWQEWRVKLGKDPQGRADHAAFGPREQQTLFEKYVQGLAVQLEQDYRRLMDQMLRPLLPSQAQDTARPAPLASFEAAQQLMEADPAFDRLLPPDRERIWRRYVQDIVAERDNPRLQRNPAAANRAAERDRGRNARETGDVVDKAYLREYLEPDQKRIRRD